MHTELQDLYTVYLKLHKYERYVKHWGNTTIY